MKIGIRIPTTIVILLIFVVILTARGTLDSVDNQTNSTTNQTIIATETPATTTSTQDEADISICFAKGWIVNSIGNFVT